MAFFSNSVLADEASNMARNFYGVCFSPDGKFLATGGEDKVIRVCTLILHMSNPYSSKLTHHTMFLYLDMGH